MDIENSEGEAASAANLAVDAEDSVEYERKYDKYGNLIEQGMESVAAPLEAPTAAPTEAPTAAPTETPTEAPTEVPTEAPTEAATEAPTEAPRAAPGQEESAADERKYNEH